MMRKLSDKPKMRHSTNYLAVLKKKIMKEKKGELSIKKRLKRYN